MANPINTSVTMPVHFSLDIDFDTPNMNIQINVTKLEEDLTEIIVNAMKEATGKIVLDKENEKE